MRTREFGSVLALSALVIGTAACGGYVKKDAYNQDVGQIRARLDSMDTQLAQNDQNDQQLEQKVNGLQEDLDQMRNEFQAKIDKLQDGLRFTMPVHFDFDKSAIRSQDRPALDRFAQVVKMHFPDAMVTVEGFADPAGSAAYNKRLSERRAKSVAGYLTSQEGMNKSQIRTVGYGENRLVKPGAAGPGQKGIENRRVTFVVEYAPSASNAPSNPTTSSRTTTGSTAG